MGSSPHPRLALIEFRARDLFSQFRVDMFPFLQGAARAKGVPVRWLFLGFDPDLQQDEALTLSLPEGDLERLIASLAELAPSHVVLNEHLDARSADLLRGRFPRLVWRQAQFSDVLLTWGELLDWLSLPTDRHADRMLADQAEPVFACTSVVPGAEPIPRLVQIVGGPSCLYSRKVSRSPFFHGLDLEGLRGHVHGCSFCGRDARHLRHPYHTPALDLTLRQIEAFARDAGASHQPPRYLIDGARVFTRVDEFFHRILARGHPPSEFFFACRADELRRHARELESVLPALARAGHTVHFSNMGVENFSPVENERLNKSISREDIAAVLGILDRWAKLWPGVVEFDRYGGFGFIMFTPWTTLEDLRINADALRELGLKNIGFCVTTRLLLLSGRPITLLAERDGLTADTFADGLMGEFCRAGCLTEWGQREIPWRFRDPRVAAIHAILLRRVPEAVAGREDGETRLVEEAIRGLPEASRDWLPLLELLLAVAEAHPHASNVADLLAHLPRSDGSASACVPSVEVAPAAAGCTLDPRSFSTRLRRLRSGRRGFAIDAIVAEPDRLRVELSRGTERLVLWIERRERRKEAFLFTERFAVYHAEATPPDTADKLAVVKAVASAIEGPRGRARSGGRQ